MNEEEITHHTLPNQSPENLQEGDLASASDEVPSGVLDVSGDPLADDGGERCAAEEDPNAEAAALPEEGADLQAAQNRQLPSASLPASDSDPRTSPSTDEGDELARLRSELTQLKEELAARELRNQRLREDYIEFSTLYPEADPDTLPDRVWEQVKRGVPLAAAYALEEKKQAVAKDQARAINNANQARTAGIVRSDETEYFSVDDVRVMSQAEVHKNYSKILQSMKKWK
ncbi:MAG: hypothetical protein IKC31_05310 [Clostridia bacterium]|nr:hypothetical protein [Clostridia bacterium]